MTWTPRDEAERAAVVGLCMDTVTEYHRHSSSLSDAAERIVPPVPVEYNDHKGVTYRDGRFCDTDGVKYDSATEVIWYNREPETGIAQPSLTDDDHAALMALKANPVKVATPEKWTGGTVTVTAQQMADDLASGRATYTTPATVAGEPVGYANFYDDGSALLSAKPEAALRLGNKAHTETAVPLYRHPATLADAVALLVREGWVEETRYECPEYFAGGTLFSTKCEHERAHARRVLIEAERAS